MPWGYCPSLIQWAGEVLEKCLFEWQAQELVFFAPCVIQQSINMKQTDKFNKANLHIKFEKLMFQVLAPC